MTNEVVLDASALIALMFREPGAEVVESRLAGALISAINAAEVADRFARDGVEADRVRTFIDKLEVRIVADDADSAFAASSFFRPTGRLGLSLGDRFCLALGKRTGRPVLTGDRSWSQIAHVVGVKVELIR